MFHHKFNKTDTIYSSSDLHVNHVNLTRGTSKWGPGNMTRDYNTVADMNKAVFDSLQAIPKECYFFLLGDILFGNKNDIHSVLDKIPTKNIIYIFGNHCDWLRKRLAVDEELNQRFLWTGDYLEVYWGHKLITFAHYPIASWRDVGQGSWMIHGHSHGSYVPGLPDTKDQGKILDIGWDVFNRPITMHEVSDIMDSKQFVQVDHHNPKTT